MIKELTNFVYNHKIILVCTIILFLFKLGAIDFDQPYIGNLDEPSVIKTSLNLFFDFNIERFDWQHANFYFQYIVIKVFLVFRNLFESIGLKFGDFYYTEPFIFYYLGRITSIVLSALTAVLAYLTLNVIFNKNTAIIGGLIFLFIPNFNSQSFYITQDTHITFWLMLSIYLITKYALEHKRWQYLFLSALTLGVAGSYKFNVLVTGGLLALILFLRNQKIDREYFFDLMISILVTISTFFAINYSIFRNWDLFWSYEPGKGFLWQVTSNSNLKPLNQLLPSMLDTFVTLTEDITPQLLIFFLVSTVVLIINIVKNKKLLQEKKVLYIIFNTLFIIGFIALFSRSNRSSSRFYLPLYFGIVLQTCAITLNKNYLSQKKIITKLVIFSLLSLLIASTSEIVLKFYFKSTNSKAIEIIQNNENVVYTKSEKLDNFKSINNLENLNKYKEEMENVYIVSQAENLDYQRVNIIDNTNRNGPKYYIYKK